MTEEFEPDTGRFVFGYHALGEGIAQVAPAAGGYRYGSILDYVLVTAVDATTCRLTATDFEVSTSVDVPAKSAHGTLLVRFEDLEGVHEAFAKGARTAAAKKKLADVTLVTGAPLLPVLRTVGRAVPLRAAKVADFPRVQSGPLPRLAEAGLGELRSAVAGVAVAAGRDDTLPMLTGVNISATGPAGLDVTTTDRFRLANAHVAGAKVDEPGQLAVGALVSAVKLGQVLADLSGERVVIGGAPDSTNPGGIGALSFTCGGVTARLLTLHGPFPQWRRLVPKEMRAHATVDPAALALEVKRMGSVAKGVHDVSLEVGGRSITVRPLGEKVVGGESKAVVQAEVTGGTGVVTHFNWPYLHQGLTSFGAAGVDKVTVHLQEAPHRPMVITPKVIKPTEEAHKNTSVPLWHLLMPIRKPSES
jgi:DNA polymerase-3 subunit beta